MLNPFEIKLNNIVSVTDNDSEHFSKVGKITFISTKKGFRRTWEYQDVTVKFENESEFVFKSWELKLNEE